MSPAPTPEAHPRRTAGPATPHRAPALRAALLLAALLASPPATAAGPEARALEAVPAGHEGPAAEAAVDGQEAPAPEPVPAGEDASAAAGEIAAGGIAADEVGAGDVGVSSDAVPLEVEITGGVTEPMTLAIPPFADGGGAAEEAAALTALVTRDLVGTGLFRALDSEASADAAPAPAEAPAADPALPDTPALDAPVAWPLWRAAGAEALLVGAVSREGERLVARFRLHDVFAGRPLGEGLAIDARPRDWRRLGHRIADEVYTRLTGEGPYLDSRVAFIEESGPRTQRVKRLALMDADGAAVRRLTDGRQLVLSPRPSPDGTRLAFVSFAEGGPRLALMDLATGATRLLPTPRGAMAFAPAWTPDGGALVYSQETAGNSDIWRLDLASGQAAPLVGGPGIDTAPSVSPDGTRLVFESDRSGSQQLYLAPLDGSAEPERISFGAARYATPAWSPKGDLIAFTRRAGGVYQIGTMRPDGSGERLLTASPHDEGPSWAPNGRVVMFTRLDPGAQGRPRLHAVDITGRNMRPVEMEAAASDPGWGPLLP